MRDGSKYARSTHLPSARKLSTRKRKPWRVAAYFASTNPPRRPLRSRTSVPPCANNAQALRAKNQAFHELANSLETLASNAEEHYADLEQLEQRLTALEEKMSAIAKAGQSRGVLFAARRELDASLRPYRGKMTADQLAMLEKQFLEKDVLERRDYPS